MAVGEANLEKCVEDVSCSVQFLYSCCVAGGMESMEVAVGREAALSLEDGVLSPMMVFSDEKVSFLLINIKPRDEECIEFVKEILDGLKERVGQTTELEVVLVCSLRLTQFENGRPFVFNLKDGGLNFNVMDSFLATWLHFCRVLEVKTTCVTAAGYRPNLAQGLAVDASIDDGYREALQSVLDRPLDGNVLF